MTRVLRTLVGNVEWCQAPAVAQTRVGALAAGRIAAHEAAKIRCEIWRLTHRLVGKKRGLRAAKTLILGADGVVLASPK